MNGTTYLIAALAIIGPAAGVIIGRLTSGVRAARQERDFWHEAWFALTKRNRQQGRRLAAYVADEKRRLAPLKAANAKRHAEATEARRIRMEAAEQRLAMREAAE